MAIHEIVVWPKDPDDDSEGRELTDEAKRSLQIYDLSGIRTTRLYRIEGATDKQAGRLAEELFIDPIIEDGDVRPVDAPRGGTEVAYKPGVMNPAAGSIKKAAHDLRIELRAADSSTEYDFGNSSDEQAGKILTSLIANPTVQHVVTERPRTLIFRGEVGPVATIPIRTLSSGEIMDLSKDTLFLDRQEMSVIQSNFRLQGRDPTDAELETIAARWSEHCGHKTFNATVVVDGVEKTPLIERIKIAAREQFGGRVISAFNDNSGVIIFYDGYAICGKVETHNSPSAIEPYGGAMTGSGGVFRDIMGTGQGAENVISTDMFCLAPPNLDESLLPPGTLHPDYLFRGVVKGVGAYGNRMGIPTANGSVHFHPDFRAKPSVIVGAYGIIPEKYAQKGEPQVGDLVVVVGGRTGRDGIHGATFSSGEMTDRTAQVNASAVQIGNAIEEKRMFDALLEARDLDLIRALTDCGAAGFSSAIGEMGEDIGVTVDISRAPLKYEGLAPWEVWLSESQERMVAAIPQEKIEEFLAVCEKYNVEASVLGEFDGSHTLTVNHGDQNVVQLDYEFLKEGLPQRVMSAHWERQEVDELRPSLPANAEEWVGRLKAVLSHGNVCSKEPIVRQYDHGVKGGNIVPPFGGINQQGPNDALVIRPLLDKPYGIVQSHGMNPILIRHDPYEGTVWAITEAAANYVSAGGRLEEAAAVGNYIWPFPDEEAMGSLDLSVDAAVEMMALLRLPVVSGKDSLSSTYRKGDQVIKIPPVYNMSIFGRIPDVEKTMTTDIKKPGSSLFLVGNYSEGMGGSTYYDVVGGSSNQIPTIDRKSLPNVLRAMQDAIGSGRVLSCHDVSEGGVATTVAEMCFGGDCGARIEAPGVLEEGMDTFLFNETAGCFVIEVEDETVINELFPNVPRMRLGNTTIERNLEVNQKSQGQGNKKIFKVSTDELRTAWQAPMKEVFHS